MQKTLIAITAALASLSSAAETAQKTEDPAFYTTKGEYTFVEFRPYLGIGTSTILQNYGSSIEGLSDMMMSPGAKFAAGVDVRFAINSGFGIGTGLSFDINNCNYAMSLINIHNGTINSLYSHSHYYYINIPVYLSWRFNLSRRILWDVEPGVYLTQGTGGTTTCNGYSSGENSLGQPVVSFATYEFKYYNDPLALVNGVSKFDWGVHLSTGITFRRHYILGFVTQIGVRNLAVNSGQLKVKYHNLSLLFKLGYSF